MTPIELRAAVVLRLGTHGHADITERITAKSKRCDISWRRDYGNVGLSDYRYASGLDAEECLRKALAYEDRADQIDARHVVD